MSEPTKPTATNSTAPRRFASVRTGATAAVLALALVGAGAIGTMVGNAAEQPTLSSSGSIPSDDTTAISGDEYLDDGAFTDMGDEFTDDGLGIDSSVAGADGSGMYDSGGSYEVGSYDSGGSYETGDDYDDGSFDGSFDSSASVTGDDPYVDTGDDGSVHQGGGDEPTGGDVDDEGEWPAEEPATTQAPTTTARPRPTPAPSSTTSAPTVSANAAPRLPARTIERRIPVGQRVDLFTDNSLAAGWTDPDHTADWLCLDFAPERRDWWLDGADCQGKGLWAQVNTPGTYVVHIRVKEATNAQPGGVGPLSAEEITLRLIAA